MFAAARTPRWCRRRGCGFLPGQGASGCGRNQREIADAISRSRH
jgi:hypothetical protein